MILCAALIFCVVATGALILFAVHDWLIAQEYEAMAEWQDAMHALGGDR